MATSIARIGSGITADLAKVAIKESTDAAVREAAEAAALAAAKESAEAVVEIAIKQAAKESAEAAIKTAAKESAEASAKVATKESISTGLTATVKTTVKESVESTGKTEAKRGAKEALKDFITKNPKLIVGGLSATALGGYAYSRFEKLNGKTFEIIRVYLLKGSGLFTREPDVLVVKIKKEKENLLRGDEVTIKNVNSVPPVNGRYKILKVNGDELTLEIRQNVLNLTKEGTAGEIQYHTTFASQLGGAVADITGGAVDAIGNAAEPVTNKLSDSFSNLGASLFSSNIGIFLFILVAIYLWLNIIYPLIKSAIDLRKETNVP